MNLKRKPRTEQVADALQEKFGVLGARTLGGSINFDSIVQIYFPNADFATNGPFDFCFVYDLLGTDDALVVAGGMPRAVVVKKANIDDLFRGWGA